MENKKMVFVELPELVRIVEATVSTAIKKFVPQKQEESEEDTWLTTKELESLLKVKRTSVWRREQEGLLKPCRMGRKKLYNKAEVQRLIDSGKLSKYVRV